MSWVTPNDVIDSWVGENQPTDTSRLQIWIDRAERHVRRRVPDLQARIDAEADLVPEETELLDTARDVVIEMVTEVFRNPDGKRSVQSTEGPFSDNVTFGGENPGKLVLTPSQASLLAATPDGEAFTFDLIAGP